MAQAAFALESTQARVGADSAALRGPEIGSADTEARLQSASKIFQAPAAKAHSENARISAKDRLQAEVAEELARGEIPQVLKESWRLVDAQSPQGQQFQEQMLKWAENFYHKHYNFWAEPPRFMLSMRPEPNAWFVPSAHPPLFVLTIGCFRAKDAESEALIKDENDLAYLVLHEFTHHAADEVVGVEAQNNKIEEAAAYARPLGIMHDLGLAPERVPELVHRMSGGTSRAEELILHELFDEHPLAETTLSVVELGLTKLRKDRGNLDSRREIHTFTENDPLFQAALAARHESYLSKELSKIEGYEEASSDEKVKSLTQIIGACSDLYEIRLDDICTELRRITETQSVAPSRTSVGMFTDRVLALPIDINAKLALYHCGAELICERGKAEPMGRLESLSALAKEFVEMVTAGDASAIEAAGAELLIAAGAEPLFSSNEGRALLCTMRWPQFIMQPLDAIPMKGKQKGWIYTGEESWICPTGAEEFDPYGEDEAVEEPQGIADLGPVVPWLALRNLAAQSEVCLNAALLMGLGRDPGIHEALAHFPDRALQIYEHHFEVDRQMHFMSMQGGLYPEISSGPRGVIAIPDVSESDDGKMLVTHGGRTEEIGLDNVTLSAAGQMVDLRPGGATAGQGSHPNRKAVVKIHDQTLRDIVRREFVNTQPDPESENRLARAAQLLAKADSAERGYQFSDFFGGPTPEKAILCLDVCERDISRFQQINGSVILSKANAGLVVERISQLVSQDRHRHTELVRSMFGLADGHIYYCPLLIQSISHQERADNSLSRGARALRDRLSVEGTEGEAEEQNIAPEQARAPLSYITANPYIKFIADDPCQIFTSEERYLVLAATIGEHLRGRMSDGLLDPKEAQALLDFVEPLARENGVQTPYQVLALEDLATLYSRPDVLAAFHKDYRVRRELEEPEVGRQPLSKRFVRSLLEARTSVLFRAGEPTLDQALACARALVPDRLASCLDLVSDMRSKLDSQISELATREPLATAIEGFRLAAQVKLFMPVRHYEVLDALVERIAGQSDCRVRADHFASLMSLEHIADPELRTKVQSLWADAIVELYGKDDSSAQFSANMFLELSKFARDEKDNRTDSLLSRIDQRDSALILAKKVVSQADLSAQLAAIANKVTVQDIARASAAAILSEAGLEGARNRPEFRHSLIDFLRAPLSDTSVQAFVDVNHQMFRHAASKLDEQMREAFVQTGREFVELNRPYWAEEERLKCRHAHMSFWAAPSEARIAIIREMLLPTREYGEELRDPTADVDPETFAYVLDKVLPQDGSEEKAFSREFAEALIASLKPYQRHAYLAGFLVAAQKTHGRELQLAETIALSLDEMGPFWRKCGQRVPGHPDVDDDFAAPFDNLTYKAAEPPRPTVVSWVEERKNRVAEEYTKYLTANALPLCDDVDEKGRVYIKHVGEVLGSASIIVAVEVTMSNGATQVLALQRPYALETGNEGYELGRDTLARMGKTGPAVDAMREIMDQTHERFELETNCLLAPEQYAKAGEIYDDTTVTVNGKEFTFEGMKVTAAGTDFYMMTKAEGDRFVHIVNREIVSDDRDDAIMAFLTLELNNIVLGLFDCDRHGGQEQLKRRHFGAYDFKGLRLEDWGKEGFAQLARLFVATIPNTKDASSFAREFLHQQKLMRESGEPVHPLVTEVQTALLVLNKYVKHLSKDQITTVVASALLNGVHPAFQEGLKSALPEAFGALVDHVFTTGELPLMAEGLGMVFSPENMIKIRRRPKAA